MEVSVPLFIQVSADRLAQTMEAVGETDVTRKFTQQEFEQMVLRSVRGRLRHQVSDLVVQIRPDGMVGSGRVRLGRFTFPLSSRMEITLVNDRPHVVIHETMVADVPLPEGMRTLLEIQINRIIDKSRYPVRFKRFEFREDALWITVERF